VKGGRPRNAEDLFEGTHTPWRDRWEVPGPCSDCGSDELCAPFDGRPLCYDHWHAAREATPPFYVRREVSLEHDEKYGYMYLGGSPPSVLTKGEAEEESEQRTSQAEQWVPVPAPNWHEGERRAHPGYMNRRRAASVEKTHAL